MLLVIFPMLLVIFPHVLVIFPRLCVHSLSVVGISAVGFFSAGYLTLHQLKRRDLKCRQISIQRNDWIGNIEILVSTGTSMFSLVLKNILGKKKTSKKVCRSPT
jgi:hypothetical protein